MRSVSYGLVVVAVLLAEGFSASAAEPVRKEVDCLTAGGVRTCESSQLMQNWESRS